MSITWNTGRNRGQSKQVDHKKIKKYHDAWARANGYKLQAPSLTVTKGFSRMIKKEKK